MFQKSVEQRCFEIIPLTSQVWIYCLSFMFGKILEVVNSRVGKYYERFDGKTFPELSKVRRYFFTNCTRDFEYIYLLSSSLLRKIWEEFQYLLNMSSILALSLTQNRLISSIQNSSFGENCIFVNWRHIFDYGFQGFLA